MKLACGGWRPVVSCALALQSITANESFRDFHLVEVRVQIFVTELQQNVDSQMWLGIRLWRVFQNAALTRKSD
jgi:hypothetical protein